MNRADGSAQAVIAMGANLGEREQTLRSAVKAIDGLAGVRVVAASGVVESHALKPSGVDAAAPSYLNAVILADVTLEPLSLLAELNAIETQFGRLRETVWGDRTLDLDLIALGNMELVSERLVLPHPRAWQRAFVLDPWLQVDPDAVIPGRGPVVNLRSEAADEVWEYPADALWEGSALSTREPTQTEVHS